MTADDAGEWMMTYTELTGRSHGPRGPSRVGAADAVYKGMSQTVTAPTASSQWTKSGAGETNETTGQRVGEMREGKKGLLAFVVFCPNSVINQHHVFSGRKRCNADHRVAQASFDFSSTPSPSRPNLPFSFTVDDTRGMSWRRLKIRLGLPRFSAGLLKTQGHSGLDIPCISTMYRIESYKPFNPRLVPVSELWDILLDQPFCLMQVPRPVPTYIPECIPGPPYTT
ncbi:hypothetical protein FB45DRAFT_1010405 [Roridomyces roridus]|uniref:Uncharacterized protein n=1 Tax=Roridomyces roridus TaxID=1738132 RepID=A0AAD7FB93_9AGAR|nr:hypothetical protein FB45DRAFT_1010405 [Roridomyces roridus]